MQIQKFKAIVERVSENIQKNGKRPFRLLVIIKPSPVDEMGDKLYKDDIFNILVPENRIPMVQELKKGDKIAVDLILNGMVWIDSNSKEQISHTLKLSKLEKIA